MRQRKNYFLPLAIDIWAAPSSEAFVEQVFSLCGDSQPGNQTDACHSWSLGEKGVS